MVVAENLHFLAQLFPVRNVMHRIYFPFGKCVLSSKTFATRELLFLIHTSSERSVSQQLWMDCVFKLGVHRFCKQREAIIVSKPHLSLS